LQNIISDIVFFDIKECREKTVKLETDRTTSYGVATDGMIFSIPRIHNVNNYIDRNNYGVADNYYSKW